MLPPGHIAAGYLTAEALLKITHPQVSATQQAKLLWWGMFFGFAPDLDYFWVFFRESSFTIKDSEKNNHRKLLSHAPVLWLAAGLIICLSASSVYVRDIGLLLWLASWSHFVLDSIEDGVMWLWPFSKRQFAFRFPPAITVSKTGFIAHWWAFLDEYRKRLTFYFEILIIILGLIIYFK